MLAVVTQTGFMTSKGQLVRSILYPPPVDFELQQDSYKFIGVLACIAIVGVFYSSYTKVRSELGSPSTSMVQFSKVRAWYATHEPAGLFMSVTHYTKVGSRAAKASQKDKPEARLVAIDTSQHLSSTK